MRCFANKYMQVILKSKSYIRFILTPAFIITWLTFQDYFEQVYSKVEAFAERQYTNF